MSMLVPPQMMNTMAPHWVPRGPGSLTGAFYADPVRRYMLPVFSDRRTDWPSHPYATRDSLHEHDMWVAEGLTHRYPTKVLAELLSTCPQYCGHCTRMDLVGNSTPSGRQAQVPGQAGRPARRDARLPAAYAVRARRRRLRRRRGQHAVEEPRLEAFLDPAARDREHPRHPAGHQGADGPAPALAAGRRTRRCGTSRWARQRPGSLPRDPHARQQRSIGDPAGGPGHQGDARRRRPRRAQPGRAAATASTPTRTRCSTCASRCSTARRSCRTTSTCAT